MGLRKAINDKCRDFIYDPELPGTWRQQVYMCAVPTCPLYPVRPAPEKDAFGRVIDLMRQDPSHPFWETEEGQRIGLTPP